MYTNTIIYNHNMTYVRNETLKNIKVNNYTMYGKFYIKNDKNIIRYDILSISEIELIV